MAVVQGNENTFVSFAISYCLECSFSVPQHTETGSGWHEKVEHIDYGLWFEYLTPRVESWLSSYGLCDLEQANYLTSASVSWN